MAVGDDAVVAVIDDCVLPVDADCAVAVVEVPVSRKQQYKVTFMFAEFASDSFDSKLEI